MVAINIIPEEAPTIPAWQKKHGFHFPVLVGAETGELMETYSFEGTPTNFIIDSEGGIVYRSDGYPPGAEIKIESVIRSELGLD